MSKRRHDETPDPAPEYREWTEHRYDPGYYVGGRLSPFVKAMQGRRSRKLGVLLIMMSVVGFGSMLVYALGGVPLEALPGLLLGGIVSAILLAVGVSHVRSARTRTRSGRR